MIDIHTHILHGVDDGAKTIEEALELIKASASIGVTDIFCTPHNMHKGQYDVHPSVLRVAFEELSRKVKEMEIPLNLWLGNEIYITSSVVDRLERGDALRLNDTKYVLIEFSMMKEHVDPEEMIYDLKASGYNVILAHPERYDYLKSAEDIVAYKRFGAQIQVNASAVVGLYGKKTQNKVMKLLKLGEVDYVASDIHASRLYTLKQAYDLIKKKFGTSLADKIFKENPKVLLSTNR